MKQLKKTIALVMAVVMVIIPIGSFAKEIIAPSAISEQNYDELSHDTVSTDEITTSAVMPATTIPEWKTWSQSDSRWGSVTLGNSGKTMASVGCAVTAVAKLVIQSGCKDPSNWNVLNLLTALNDNNGFTGASIYWSRPAELISGFTLEDVNSYTISSNNIQSSIIEWVQNGYHIVLRVPSSSTHYIAVDNELTLANNAVYIMDSRSDTSSNANVLLTSRYSTVYQIIRYKGLVTYIDSEDQPIIGPSTLSLTNYNYPTSVAEGSAFYLTGIISSNYHLEWVYVAIINSAGNAVTSKSLTPYTYSVNIATQIDNDIHFTWLSAGQYIYHVEATDVSGNFQVLLSCSFTVYNNSAPQEPTPHIMVNKTVVGVGEEITMEYSGLTECSCAGFNYIKDGEVYYFQDSTSSRTYTSWFNNSGHYQISSCGLLNGIWYESERIDIFVCSNLGDDFYAVILNYDCWKPISLVSGSENIFLETETGTAMQKWHFVRQSDATYIITSCQNGRALEMTDGIREICTQLTAHIEWGGDYQKWIIMQQGNGYILQAKHYAQEEWVMDLYGAYSYDHNIIQINQRNNSPAQIWQIYAGDEIQLHATNLTVNINAPTVTFSWENRYGAKNYNLKIWKDTLWEGESYYTAYNASTGIQLDLPQGTYYAYVDTCDYYQYIPSNIIELNIPRVEYTLFFNPNGGTVTTASKQIAFAEQYGALPVPTREAYTFEGWYTEINGGTLITDESIVTVKSNQTLYAHWSSQQIIGDANLDGTLSFADVAALYNMIFAGGSFTSQQQYICDVNGDGAVSFADVAALYNAVLGGSAA